MMAKATGSFVKDNCNEVALTEPTGGAASKSGNGAIDSRQFYDDFPFLRDAGHREFVKELISLSSDTKEADKVIRRYGQIESNDTEECYSSKIRFLSGLFSTYKLAACDPSWATDLDKRRVDYWGLLAAIQNVR
jgi:hypothetical protein